MKTNLRHWRTKRVLSINMLASRAEVAPATIVNIEKQKHTPNPETLHKLAKALQISVEQLLDEEERPVLAHLASLPITDHPCRNRTQWRTAPRSLEDLRPRYAQNRT